MSILWTQKGTVSARMRLNQFHGNRDYKNWEWSYFLALSWWEPPGSELTFVHCVYSLSPPSYVLISSWISWNRGPFKTDWVLCSPGFSCLLRALVLTVSALWEFLRREEFTCDVCIPSTSLISSSQLSPSEPHWVNRCVSRLIAFIWMAAAGILKQVCH